MGDADKNADEHADNIIHSKCWPSIGLLPFQTATSFCKASKGDADEDADEHAGDALRNRSPNSLHLLIPLPANPQAAASSGKAAKSDANEDAEEDADDALRYGPQPDQLVSKAGGVRASGGRADDNGAGGGTGLGGGDGIYRPPRINAVSMETCVVSELVLVLKCELGIAWLVC